MISGDIVESGEACKSGTDESRSGHGGGWERWISGSVPLWPCRDCMGTTVAQATGRQSRPTVPGGNSRGKLEAGIGWQGEAI